MSEKNTKRAKTETIGEKPVTRQEPKTNPGKYIFDFDIEEMVYLKTDPEQLERIVTGIQIRKDGITYLIGCGADESLHYGFEITKERDIIKATSS